MLALKFPPHGSRADRYHAVLDGVDVGLVSSGTIHDLGLDEKTGIAPERVPLLADAIAALAVYDAAVRLLAAQARSKSDLARTLKRRGMEEKHIILAVARLEELGLLDDARFAEDFSRSRVQGAGYAAYRLRQELSRRGIRGEIADTAIEQVIADPLVDTEGALERIVTRKMRSMSGLEPQVQRRRLFGFLARRGYGADAIRVAVERALGATEDVSGDDSEDVPGDVSGDDS